MDSHSAATLAFGRPTSRSRLSNIFGQVSRATRRTTSGRPGSRRRRKHHKAKVSHHRRSGVVIPNEMLKMLAFISIVDKIRGS
jgi:hypothetical protein